MKSNRLNPPESSAALKLALPLMALLLVSACSSLTPRPATPISTVVNAAESGASSDKIISDIRAADTVYALRGSDFAKLAELGVPAPVLDELQQRFFGEIEFLTKRYYSGRNAGGPASTYPVPINLASLDAGGTGMVPTDYVGQVTHGTRPPGVPEWVPPYPNLSGPTFSPDELVQMTRNGRSTQELVEMVRNSRVDTLYADNSNAVSLRRTAALTGSDFANLAKQGVASDVLDALQATYLAQHIEWARRAAPRGTGGSANP